jgi:hypothetical protein
MQSHIRRIFATGLACLLATFATIAGAASLDVNPNFAAYGQAISVTLNDIGPAPYFPVTRYHRDGANISIEIEHMAGGYFGPRSDMMYMPVALGELAPGHYNLQAKLFDINDPAAAPRLFARGLDIAPPDSTGVYAAPRMPGGYESFELVVVADAPVDPASVKATVTGSAIRVDFDYSTDASAKPFASVKVHGLQPGSYRAEAFGRVSTAMVPARRFVGDFNVDSTSSVVEYYAPNLDHYVLSAWPDEVDALDADPRASFERTGERFKAWLHVNDAPAIAAPVCRFYASKPNSHFYTADADECQFLKSLEQKQKAEASAKGQAFGGWQFEAVAFYALVPQQGQCPVGSIPVYRAYNNRAAQEDPNHRFTVTVAMREAMAKSWVDEGVAFCSPL